MCLRKQHHNAFGSGRERREDPNSLGTPTALCGTQIVLELLPLCVAQHNCCTPYLAHPSQGERGELRPGAGAEKQPHLSHRSWRPQASVVTATKSLRIALLLSILNFQDGGTVFEVLSYGLRANIPFNAIFMNTSS